MRSVMQAATASAPPTEPGCVSAEEAFRQLGIDRTTGYRAIKDGTFPLPVVRVGRLIKVPIAALRRLLAVDAERYDDDEKPDGH